MLNCASYFLNFSTLIIDMVQKGPKIQYVSTKTSDVNDLVNSHLLIKFANLLPCLVHSAQVGEVNERRRIWTLNISETSWNPKINFHKGHDFIYMKKTILEYNLKQKHPRRKFGNWMVFSSSWIAINCDALLVKQLFVVPYEIAVRNSGTNSSVFYPNLYNGCAVTGVLFLQTNPLVNLEIGQS